MFLAHIDAAGSEGFTELPAEEGCSTFFLPDSPSTGEISLSPHIDSEHSYLCLEIHQRFVLLRIFNESHGPCSIVGENQTYFQLPVSVTSHLVSTILRPGDHFLAPSGRWAVRWDEDGKISESMNPPPLPLVTDGVETTDAYPDTLDERLCEGIDSPSRSSEATCSPTPSPTKGNEHYGSCTKANEQPQPSPEDPAAPATSQENTVVVGANSEERHLVAQPEPVEELDLVVESSPTSSAADHVAESKCAPEAADVAMYMPAVPISDGVEKIPAPFENSLSSADNARTPSNSHEVTKEPHEYGSISTPSPLEEPRGSKRKLEEIEAADSGHNTTDAESNASTNTGPADNIAVNRKSKRSYSSKDTSYIAKTPSKQTRSRQSSTPSGISQSNTKGDQPPTKRRSDRRQGTPSKGGYRGSTPVVIFSSATTVDQEKTTMRTFRKLGGKVTEAILEATILCVPEGPLKKTSKLVRAVALGIDIVTEHWIAETHRLGEFPAPQSYLPSDKHSEQEWDTSLRDAIARGKSGLAHLLSGITVFFTKKLRSDLGKLERDFSQIATRLGAESVERRLPSLKDDRKPADTAVLIVGARDDPQGALVGRLGFTLFNKDILVMAALRGRLERDCEDFAMEVPIKEEEA